MLEVRWLLAMGETSPGNTIVTQAGCHKGDIFFEERPYRDHATKQVFHASKSMIEYQEPVDMILSNIPSFT